MAVDLALVRTFVLLYESGSVTRTAEKLSVTQSSVSHALARLRQQVGDPLFVRTPQGLEPNDTARRLYPDFRVGLEAIDRAVGGTARFDAATSSRTFRVLATDLAAGAMLPTLLARLEQTSPGLGLEIIALDVATAATQLQHGQADAAVCTPRLTGSDLRRDVLFRDHYVGLCACDHPRLGAAPGRAEFAAERHVVVDRVVGHPQADDIESGIDVAVRVPSFAAVPRLVAATTLVGIVPSTMTAWFTRTADVRTFPLPTPSPELEAALYTFARRPVDPAVNWFRDLLLSTSRP